MGIRHLYTFITQNVDRGFVVVNIRDSVETYKRENPGLTPTIVIDIMSLIDHIFISKHETLLGGRFNIYNDRARDIFSKLKSLGVNLVFFVDGPTPEEKIETCLKRRESSYSKGVTILHAIDNGLDIGGTYSVSNLDVQSVITYLKNLTEVAGDYGEVYTSILNDCDQDIVVLATERNALAIIGDDSDFLIFKGNWHYWSGKNLNVKDLITKEYKKDALRSALSLTDKQMAIFASLGGNDIVPYEELQEFHRRISIQYNCVRNNFKAMAQFVKSLNSVPPHLNDYDKNIIKNQISYLRNKDRIMEAIQGSLNFYCLQDLKHPDDKDPLMQFIHDPKKFNHLIFITLTNTKYICNFIYQDLRKNVLTPHFDLVKPILCRMMGVLLKNEEKKDDNKRIFYFKLDHFKSYESVNLYPDYPSYNVPAVLDLLSRPCKENADFDKTRWNLLCFIISKKLNEVELRKIPKENLAIVLSLFYLVERKEITVDEADCILISCNMPMEKQQSLDKNDVRKITGRDARLAFFFGRFYILIKDCISTVGLRDYESSSPSRFDGLYFHYLRNKWQNSGEEFKKKELELINSLRLYSEDFALL